MLEEILSEIGVRDEEAQTYLVLLGMGVCSAGALATKMRIPRPTLYGYLERLETMGLASQLAGGGVKQFQAQPPTRLKQIYARRIEALESKRKRLDDILPKLEELASFKSSKPRTHVYEGREGMEMICEDFLQYSDITSYAFWPISKMLEIVGEDYVHYHNKERIRKNISIQALWFNDRMVPIKRYPYLGAHPELLRETRIAPDDINPTMGYWVYENKTMVVSSTSESFGMLIESYEFADMMKIQHQLIWNVSKPIMAKRDDIKLFLDEMTKES